MTSSKANMPKRRSYIQSRSDRKRELIAAGLPCPGNTETEDWVTSDAGANIDLSRGLANGTIGTVEDFTPFPVVKFDKLETAVQIDPFKWITTSKDGVSVVASMQQVPLILAWAITIHRAQGLTLPRVNVSLANIFSFGHAYVALSRVAVFGRLVPGRAF